MNINYAYNKLNRISFFHQQSTTLIAQGYDQQQLIQDRRNYSNYIFKYITRSAKTNQVAYYINFLFSYTRKSFRSYRNQILNSEAGIFII